MDTHEKAHQKALEVGESLLQQREKILGAIEEAEQQLPAAVDRKVAAQKASDETESAFALDETDFKTVERARKELAEADCTLNGLSSKIRGLRARLDAQVGELTHAHAEVERHQSAFNEQLANNFRREWLEGVVAFSRLLSKRAALEAILPKRIDDLPEPSAGNEIALPAEQSRPSRVLSGLHGAISAISAARAMETRLASKVPAPYDPDAVYIFKRPFTHLSRAFVPGQHVNGSVLGDGLAQWCLRQRIITPLPLDSAPREHEGSELVLT